MAKYTDHGATYERTVLVKRGSPSGLFGAGLFQDKINLTADQTDGEFAGNVYTAWSQYHGLQSGNNSVLFARSTDHGLSYSRPFSYLLPPLPGNATSALPRCAASKRPADRGPGWPRLCSWPTGCCSTSRA